MIMSKLITPNNRMSIFKLSPIQPRHEIVEPRLLVH